MDHRRGCPVPEVGLGTSYQAGPNPFSLQVRGDIDVSKVRASPSGASNDESIGLGDEQLPILDHGAEFVDVKAVEKLDDFSRRVHARRTGGQRGVTQSHDDLRITRFRDSDQHPDVYLRDPRTDTRTDCPSWSGSAPILYCRMWSTGIGTYRSVSPRRSAARRRRDPAR